MESTRQRCESVSYDAASPGIPVCVMLKRVPTCTALPVIMVPVRSNGVLYFLAPTAERAADVCPLTLGDDGCHPLCTCFMFCVFVSVCLLPICACPWLMAGWPFRKPPLFRRCVQQWYCQCVRSHDKLLSFQAFGLQSSTPCFYRYFCRVQTSFSSLGQASNSSSNITNIDARSAFVRICTRVIHTHPPHSCTQDLRESGVRRLLFEAPQGGPHVPAVLGPDRQEDVGTGAVCGRRCGSRSSSRYRRRRPQVRSRFAVRGQRTLRAVF